jgi:hypothetical protein
MKYTKPNILFTSVASTVVQTGAGSGLKQHPLFLESTGTGIRNSTTGAYEADE